MNPDSVVFARYQLHERIGAGAAGVVWRATDQRLDQPVALKRISFAAVGHEQARVIRDRALREARLAAQLRGHPNVVTIYDVLEGNDEDIWLVMEYVPAQSLSQLLATQERLDVVRTAQIGAHIANALAAAHHLGIEHRDIKPSNVLIGADGTVKLTDFGISHLTGDPRLTQTGISGTPAYLAPEVADRGESSSASDVFSLGATLYAAIEGQPPFGTDDNILRLLGVVRTGIIRSPTNAGPLEPLLLRLLQLNPATRPDATTARDLLSKVATQSHGATGPIRSKPGLKPAWWRPRQRTAVVTGALAAITAGALVAITALADSTNGESSPSGNTPPSNAEPSSAEPSGPVPVTSDPRYADPCPLISIPALNTYGSVEILPWSSFLEGCQARISTQAGSISLRVHFDNYEPASDLPGDQRSIDGMTIVTEGLVTNFEDSADCRKYIVLDGAPQIIINAFRYPKDDTTMLCDVAEAAAVGVVNELNNRGRKVPVDEMRHAGYLLAASNVCDLLDKPALDAVVGLDSNEPDADYANWSCRWEIKDSEINISLYFQLRSSFGGLKGVQQTIAENPAYLVGEPGDCDIYVPVAEHPIPNEDSVKETLFLSVGAESLSETEACGLAKDLADTAVRSLR